MIEISYKPKIGIANPTCEITSGGVRNAATPNVPIMAYLRLAASVLATGILGFADPTYDKRPGYATLLGSGLTGLGLGILGSKHLRFTQGDQALSALGTIEGLWYGGFGTDYSAQPDDKIQPGTLVGAGLGFFVCPQRVVCRTAFYATSCSN